jgi:hypothetical protein
MNSRRTWLWIGAAAALAPLAARAAAVRGSGQVVQREIAVAAFEGIELRGDVAIELRQAQPPRVTIEADDNLVGRLHAEVEERTLKLSIDGRIEPTRWAVTVDVWRLEALALGGSARLQARELACKRLVLTQGGSSVVRIEALVVEALTLRGSGSASTTLAGRANELEASLGGSAHADLGGLDTRRVTVGLGGSSMATVAASALLAGSLGGSSRLRYRGDPRLTVTRGGSAAVERI